MKGSLQSIILFLIEKMERFELKSYYLNNNFGIV